VIELKLPGRTADAADVETGDEAATPPRRAGEHARQRARLLDIRVLIFVASLTVMAAVAALLIDPLSPAFLPVDVVWIGGTLLVYRTISPQSQRWAQGAAGEEKVGAIIEGMSSEGWLPIHDVDLGRGNVDHVLVGPPGLFTIETKSHRGKIRVGRVPRAMLSQAYAQSKSIESIIGLPVAPLLVFSDAYLIGKVPAKRRGVLVLPARMLSGRLGRYAPLYTPQEVADLHRRLHFALRASGAC